MRMRVILGVLMIAAIVAPVGAQAADPVIMTGGASGPGWKAFEVTTNGSPFTITFNLVVHQEHQMVGTSVFSADNTHMPGWRFTAYQSKDTGEIDINAGEGVEYHVEQQGNDHSTGYTVKIEGTYTSQTLPGTPANPKTYKILNFTLGNASTPATWTMSAPSGITIGDQTSGDETYMLWASDFEAPNRFFAEEVTPPVPTAAPGGVAAGAHGVVTGRKVIDVDGVFLGTWDATKIPIFNGQPYGVNVHQAAVTDVNNVQRDCTISCFFSDYKAPGIAKGPGGYAGLGPGRYTFEHTGAGAGVGMFGNTLLWGMDVRLPE